LDDPPRLDNKPMAYKNECLLISCAT